MAGSFNLKDLCSDNLGNGFAKYIRVIMDQPLDCLYELRLF
ncbi:hypothetical protein MNBD_ALPHA11-320 [hydrothermal vent metagenome]|uniref:Uncharacterized protein n=1 Tax=hydrothermal vent metagenome TaxID=652676 RepID=A0A3B0UKT3_9ZZZZ